MPRILSLRLSLRHLQLRCDISDVAPYDTSGIAKLLAHVARMCGLMAAFAHKIRPAQQLYEAKLCVNDKRLHEMTWSTRLAWFVPLSWSCS